MIFCMSYIHFGPDELEAFAKTVDAYAKQLRDWKPVMAEAIREGVESELNGIQTLQGNFDREVLKLAKMEGQIAAIRAEVKQKIAKRAASDQAATPVRKGKGK